MDKHWSTVCALIVAFCALVHFGTVSSAVAGVKALREKPGGCPRRRLAFGHCTKSCSYDSECHINEKCCFNGCGHECMAPVIARCPSHLSLAVSRKGCKDCPRDHICCLSDGEDICVPPVSPKPGFCPRTPLVNGLCVEACSHDNECPDKQKCCSNGCGHECKAPAVD